MNKAETAPKPHLKRNRGYALIVLVLLFALVLAVWWFGRSSMDMQDGRYLSWFGTLRESQWAPFYVILTYIVAAFLGVPQWMLIAGTVFAFGPLLGGIYSWVSTLVSATVNFWLGRWAGAERVEGYVGRRLEGLARAIRRNGFMVSMGVRIVPAGPFVLVNTLAGVSGMGYLAFMGGTAVGVIPKIAIIALLGQGVLASNQGRVYMFGFLAIAVFLGSGIWLLKHKLAPVAREGADDIPKG
ncbi:MAG: TVP38/TMEM64 family protein [Hyphomonadaceae bacterium]|nr:TVP38/TMEM64 family protein [Hyphomonadaceae bacterium]MBC6411684.1 TVP38/TMEM64 family protein [Hyphomonadaceae bacterium]